MKRFSSFTGSVLLLVLLGFAGARAQPSLLGIGLSASSSVLDTVIANGDTLSVIVSFTTAPGIRMEGVALGASQLRQIQVNFYALFPPSGPVQSFDVVVNPAAIQIDTLAQPPQLRFTVLMPFAGPSVSSLQINLAVYGRDSTDQVLLSDRHSSYIAVGSVTPLDNPVDPFHGQYLRVMDLQTQQPTFLSPQRGSILGRQFTVRYGQPEDAAPGTLVLMIDNMDSAAQDTHRFYLHNRTAGLFKILNLNANALFVSQEMDSSAGTNSLRHAALYKFRISYQDVHFNPPAYNDVDSVLVDLRTEPPVIMTPVAGRAVPRRFTIQYNQPETALPGSVFLVFTNVDTESFEDPHTLYLRDLAAGSNKLLSIDALALFDSTTMDSMLGVPGLQSDANYELLLSYQDILRNAPASAAVSPIHLDVQTEPPLLFEPRAGSSTTDSTVRVIYELPEMADTVWLSFIEDSVSSIHDTLSPHILRLIPALNGPGVVSCFLNGWNIGTGGLNVAESNRGESDALVAQCVYTVTLSYGDLTGNAPQAVSNNRYVWPRDEITLPPSLLEPTNFSAFPASFRVVFSLPEAPLPGSVYVRIAGLLSNDRGSPHRIYLRNLVPGLNSLTMSAAALSQGQSVDSVAGAGTPAENNTLVDGVQYIFHIFYRDSSGNDAASSGLPNYATFDNHTEPIAFLSPHAGDTLDRVNITVLYEQPEQARSNSLHMIFERIAGGDDPNRHVLRLQADSAGEKSITIHASALSTTPGADTVSGGDALVLRAVYRLSLEYQDTLLNERAVSYVDNLAYPSGAIVIAGGVSLGGGQVVPGEARHQAFRLSLHTTNGQSVLRELRFWPDGTMDARDLNTTQVHLWASVDTIFSDQQDQIIGSLSSWGGGEIVFRSLSTEVQELEAYYFITLGFYSAANAAHRVRLQLLSPASIDCGGDPVLATHWPLGERDVALAVTLTDFGADQDTVFGALRIWWTVASETDNQGFTLLRRDPAGNEFQPIASWRDRPELVGRGTSPTAVRYQVSDLGLVPGAQYTYRLAIESFTGDVENFETEAIGIPRVPPNNFVLGDAYPNPFNQTVTIPYIVPYTAVVELTIYNVLGQKVCRLSRGLLIPAEYRARWNGRDDAGIPVTSGLYLVRMEAAGTFDKTRKIFLLR
jgi:hypothetical protein